jgi:hypothetical protein
MGPPNNKIRNANSTMPIAWQKKDIKIMEALALKFLRFKYCGKKRLIAGLTPNEERDATNPMSV